MPLTLEEALARINFLERKIDELKEENKHLERLSTRDPLTGLLNRRGGEEVLAHHYSILSRDNCEKNNFAVLNLDLDRFKGINDTYGHEIGDKVLKFFGKILYKNLRGRDHDAVIRNGGDEFTIILPDCTYEHAKIVKQKIKIALEEEHFKEGNIALSLRTSIGIAMARMVDGEILLLNEIIRNADANMYQDKAKGRVLRNSEREFARN